MGPIVAHSELRRASADGFTRNRRARQEYAGRLHDGPDSSSFLVRLVQVGVDVVSVQLRQMAEGAMPKIPGQVILMMIPPKWT